MFARRRLLNNQGLQLLLYVHNEHTHTQVSQCNEPVLSQHGAN